MTIWSLTMRYITKTRNLPSSAKSKGEPPACCTGLSTHGLETGGRVGQVIPRDWICLTSKAALLSRPETWAKKPANPVFFHWTKRGARWAANVLEGTSGLRLGFCGASGRRKDGAKRKMPAQPHLPCWAVCPLSRRDTWPQQLEQTGQTAGAAGWRAGAVCLAQLGRGRLSSVLCRAQTPSTVTKRKSKWCQRCSPIPPVLFTPVQMRWKGQHRPSPKAVALWHIPNTIPGEREPGNGLVPQENHIPCSCHPPVPKPACPLRHTHISGLMKLFPFRACYPYLGFVRAAMLEWPRTWEQLYQTTQRWR